MDSNELLKEVPDSLRRLSVLFLMTGSVFCAVCFLACLVLGTYAVLKPNGNPASLLDILRLVACLLIFAFLSISMGWIAIRFRSGRRSANGWTYLPTWTLMVFGCVMVALSMVELFVRGNGWAAAKSFLLGIGCLGISARLKLVRTSVEETL